MFVNVGQPPRRVTMAQCDKCGKQWYLNGEFNTFMTVMSKVNENAPPPETKHHCVNRENCNERASGKRPGIAIG